MSAAAPDAFTVSVDIVLLTLREERLQVLLIRRGIPPFEGWWALPGGRVRMDEDLDAAARRELQEETGVERFEGHLEQLATYGTPERDPRGRVVTVGYLALMPDLPVPVAGTDAADARWWPADELPSLAFDHDRIVADGIERAKAKLEYTTLATAFVEAPFTLRQLRQVYEAIWGVPLQPANFRRKVLTADPRFVVEAGETPPRSPREDRGRPAARFRPGPATLLHPPILRPEPGRR